MDTGEARSPHPTNKHREWGRRIKGGPTKTRKWNLQPIQEDISEGERQAMHAIYLSKHEVEDRLVWATSVTRVATPKMVYRQLRETTLESLNKRATDRSQEENAKWAKLWKGRAIPKVKSFLWQEGHQSILVPAVLERRWINVT